MVDHASISVTALEPRIGKIDKRAAHFCVPEDGVQVQRCVTEYGCHRNSLRLCALVHEVDQVFSDLEPNIGTTWFGSRSLK